MSEEKTESAQKGLKSAMPMYKARINNAMGALETGAPLNLEDFFMHFEDEGPMEAAAEYLEGSHTILDIGCGFGATVIWLAQHSDEIRALAGVDLLDEHIQVAQSLRKRLLADDYRVSFFTHDATALDADLLGDGCGLDQVDGALALNVGMHLTEAQHGELWHFLAEVLAPRGRVFIEDLYRLRVPDENEESLLVGQVACPQLLSIGEYTDHLSMAFDDAVVVPEDITLDYAAFAERRYLSYDGDDEIRREYYRAMSVLLGDGAVGAVRIKLERE
jgi:SAM-dependent methyltransferase